MSEIEGAWNVLKEIGRLLQVWLNKFRSKSVARLPENMEAKKQETSIKSSENQCFKNDTKSRIFYLYIKQITERPDVPYRHYFSYLRVEWKDVDSFSLELAQEFLQSRSYTLNYHNGEAYDDLTVTVAVMESQEFCEKFDDAFCAANGNVNRRNLMDVEKALKNFFFGLEQRIKERRNDEGIDVQEGNGDIPF